MPAVEPTVAIRGRTYPVKEELKALGGTWDPDEKAWMVPARNAKDARALVLNCEGQMDLFGEGDECPL